MREQHKLVHTSVLESSHTEALQPYSPLHLVEQLCVKDYLDGPGSWLTQLRLLQQHPQVDNVALCNFDTAHARIAIASGVQVVANQVSFSLLDRRAAGPMSGLCGESQMRLLAFGVLAGGLLTDR